MDEYAQILKKLQALAEKVDAGFAKTNAAQQETNLHVKTVNGSVREPEAFVRAQEALNRDQRACARQLAIQLAVVEEMAAQESRRSWWTLEWVFPLTILAAALGTMVMQFVK